MPVKDKVKRSVYNRRYRERHRDVIRAISKRFYARHRESEHIRNQIRYYKHRPRELLRLRNRGRRMSKSLLKDKLGTFNNGELEIIPIEGGLHVKLYLKMKRLGISIQ